MSLGFGCRYKQNFQTIEIRQFDRAGPDGPVGGSWMACRARAGWRRGRKNPPRECAGYAGAALVDIHANT